METPCPKREQPISTTLTHPLGRKSPQCAEVLSFVKQKLILVVFGNSLLRGFPPVLLEKAGSTFANKKIISTQFQVDPEIWEWRVQLVLSARLCFSLALPPNFHLISASFLLFPFFPSGLVAHWFIVKFLRSFNSNKCGRHGAGGKWIDTCTLWSSPLGLAVCLLSSQCQKCTCKPS